MVATHARLGQRWLCAALCCLGLNSGAAHALEFALQGGYEYGGDNVLEVTFQDGERESLRAGSGLLVSVGVIMATLPASAPALETQINMGWKFDSVSAGNGDATWMLFPLELLQFYRIGSWRIGGGLAMHLSPQLSGSGALDGADAGFDDAAGAVFEVDYINRSAYIALRATLIEYEYIGTQLDGNNIGVMVGLRF
jgi:hypothetical protein